MKKPVIKIKSAVRILCFFLILIAILSTSNQILKMKYSDGIYSVTKFYELKKDMVDVLILGSSRAFENINTGILWDEYGIASYILAGSEQPMWNTYYYLKEALKTQTPELIILEGFYTENDKEYMNDSQIIKNNYGLKWSLDKINSLKSSVPRERWSEFFFTYTQYHTRYKELGPEDFLKNQGYRPYDDWKGFYVNMWTLPLESIDVSEVKERTALNEKTEKYYRAVIELAQEKNIPIIVVISPYAAITAYEQQKFNTAGDIALEYQVPFINFNLFVEQIGIDYSSDAADYNHLNYKGSQKYTHYLGKYLKEHFQISNHIGDTTYDSWQRSADITRQLIQDQILRETYDIDMISQLIQNTNYWVILSVDGECSTSDMYLSSFFEQFDIFDKGLSGVWLKKDNQIVWYSGMQNAEQFLDTPMHDFCMRRIPNEFGEYVNIVIADKAPYKKVENGVNVLIFDAKTEEIVDMFGINIDEEYQIIK